LKTQLLIILNLFKPWEELATVSRFVLA